MVAVCCFFFGFVTLTNTFVRWMPWEKNPSRQSSPLHEINPPAYQFTLHFQSGTEAKGTDTKGADTKGADTKGTDTKDTETKDTEANGANLKGFCHCVLLDYMENGVHHRYNLSTTPSVDTFTALLDDQPKGIDRHAGHDSNVLSNHSRFLHSRATTLRGERSTLGLHPSNSISAGSSMRSLEAGVESRNHTKVASSAPSFAETLPSEEATGACLA